MAGGHMKYRHLSRSSSHRQALLRNLVTSLFKHETIATTWHKAKEAQRLAEQLVTLGKRNTEAARRRAHQIFYEPLTLVPKLFGPFRERYANRPGGYTRVSRIESMKEDQAESAILELVDGPRDMHFAMTAKALARREERFGHTNPRYTPKIADHVKKAIQFREHGADQLRKMVDRMRLKHIAGVDQRLLAPPRTVYLEGKVRTTQRYFGKDTEEWEKKRENREKHMKHRMERRLERHKERERTEERSKMGKKSTRNSRAVVPDVVVHESSV